MSDYKIKSKTKLKSRRNTKVKKPHDIGISSYNTTRRRKPVFKSNIDIKDDFYSHINDDWIKHYKLGDEQQYITQIDDFFIVQDKVYHELLDMAKSYINTHDTKLSKCISKFYKSVRDLNTNKQSHKHANSVLENINSLREDKSNVWILLAMVNSNEIVSTGSPLVWSIYADDKDPGINRCYIDYPILTLIDDDLYNDDYNEMSKSEAENKRLYKSHYMKYLKELFANSFGADHKFNVEDVFKIEKKLVDAKNYNKIKNEDIDGYNVVHSSESLEKYGFDWVSFTKALGYKHTPEFFITESLNYLQRISNLLVKEWDTDEWKTYWIYLFIKQQQKFNIDGHIINYNFNGKFVAGQDYEIGRELFPVYSLSYAFNAFLTREYEGIAKNDETLKNYEYIERTTKDLLVILKRILQENTWLHSETKKYALQKLDAIKLEVGVPTNLEEDPMLDYSDDDIWSNLLQLTEWKHKNKLTLEGKSVGDVPEIDWTLTPPKLIGTQAYVVNAYYTETKNKITIPLGYIQKPFIDLDRGMEYNLAYMGFTIAHEISHALDDLGSKYDENGKLKDWWTYNDRTKFNSLQNDIINQYEAFAMYDGIEFDATPSIGEDIADIVGLRICVAYLLEYHANKSSPQSIQNSSFETFFSFYAIQQRQIIKKHALDIQLKTNPHPLDKYRTNVPLSRIPLFRKIYDIQKKDKMYWHSLNCIW
uniref:Peptidase M13 C-terminal domain-containing protein n=1 Tax=viral metagenome TaxID=1070528 RepID=A0A6C0E681_9ZZZZ